MDIHHLPTIIFPFLFFLLISFSSSPVAATKSGPEVQVQSRIHRSFLDRAIRILHNNGFVMAATALALRRTELLPLPEVTIFAPSDRVFFSSRGDFRYDPRCHVVPERLNFDRMASFTDGVKFKTLAPGKPVFIESATDAVTVNGVKIDGAEVYQNRWLVLYSMEPKCTSAGKLDESSSAPEIPVLVVSNDTIVHVTGESTDSGPGGFLLPPENRTVVSSASDQIGKMLMPYIPVRFPAPVSKFVDRIETRDPAPVSRQDPDLEDKIGSPAISQFSLALINKDASFQGNVSVITASDVISELFCPAPDDQVPTEQPARGEGAASFDHLKRLLLLSEGRGKRVPGSANMATDMSYYPEFACSSFEFGGNIL